MKKEKDVLNTALAVLFYFVMATGILLLVVEWAAGCGETWVDSLGARHPYECVVLPTPMPEETP